MSRYEPAGESDTIPRHICPELLMGIRATEFALSYLQSEPGEVVIENRTVFTDDGLLCPECRLTREGINNV